VEQLNGNRTKSKLNTDRIFCKIDRSIYDNHSNSVFPKSIDSEPGKKSLYFRYVLEVKILASCFLFLQQLVFIIH